MQQQYDMADDSSTLWGTRICEGVNVGQWDIVSTFT